MLSLCLLGSLRVLLVPPTVHKHAYEVNLKLNTGYRCECGFEWLFVSMWTCDALATRPQCHLPSPDDTRERLQLTFVTLSSGRSQC